MLDLESTKEQPGQREDFQKGNHSSSKVLAGTEPTLEDGSWVGSKPGHPGDRKGRHRRLCWGGHAEVQGH